MSIFNALSQNNMMGLVNQFLQFKKTFTGNPQQQIQQLVNSGRISQTQYEQALQQAKALQEILKNIR